MEKFTVKFSYEVEVKADSFGEAKENALDIFQNVDKCDICEVQKG